MGFSGKSNKESGKTATITEYPGLVAKGGCRKVLAHKKALVRTIVSVVGGSCPVRANLRTWRVNIEDLCRECGEEKETVEHMLRRCPALEYQHLNTMGHNFLSELDDVATPDIIGIMRITTSWNCFREILKPKKQA